MGVSAIQTERSAALEQWNPSRTRTGRGRHDRVDIATLRALGRPLDTHDPSVIRDVAAQMVSELFFVPMLAEMRTFPFGNEFGHGGRGEAVFGEQLDQRVADVVASAGHGGLVEQIAKRLERAQHSPPPSQGADGDGADPTRSADTLLAQASWLTRQQVQQKAEGHGDVA